MGLNKMRKDGAPPVSKSEGVNIRTQAKNGLEWARGASRRGADEASAPTQVG
jgi:hypothetical protein